MMSSTIKVILLERVEKLGKIGETVNVKPGFARNFLLPKKKALRASKENIAYFAAQKKSIEDTSAKMQKEAEKLAKKLKGVKAPLIRQASESGHLYGSVNSRDIAEVVSEVSKEAVTRNMVHLTDNIKTIGLIPVEIVLHPEVKVELIINIARSVEEAKIQDETGRALIADASYEEPVIEDVPEVSEEADNAETEASEEEAA